MDLAAGKIRCGGRRLALPTAAIARRLPHPQAPKHPHSAASDAWDGVIDLATFRTGQATNTLSTFDTTMALDVKLILASGKQKGRETALARGVYLVGRSRLCQIRPKNKWVSRTHCAIIHKRGEVLLQDMGSKHGTYLNKVKIDEGVAVAVADGDLIQLGTTRFRFKLTTVHKKHRSSDEQLGSQLEHAAKPVGKQQTGERKSGKDRRAELAEAEDHSPIDVDALLREGAAAERDEPTGPHDANAAVDDILALLEDDKEADSGINFMPVDVYGKPLEELEDGEDDDAVDFAAPKSVNSLDPDQPIPSYQLRQDWDVKSVQQWLGQKQQEAAQTKKLPQRKFKPKDKKKAKELKAEEKELEERKNKILGKEPEPQPAWMTWLEGDSVKPLVLGTVIVLFVTWVIYNAWLLYSFDG